MIRSIFHPLVGGFFALVLVLFAPGAVKAAESYDNCQGVITSVPATITTQGVWCLKSSLMYAPITGTAIRIDANNVTLDCNHFYVDKFGSAGGTRGIGTGPNVLNATVRNCGVRGFRAGIDLSGSGHLVEKNFLDRNILVGISVMGSNNRVAGNRVSNMRGGAAVSADYVYGIVAAGDVIGNTVSGLTPASGPYVIGIRAHEGASEVSGNIVRGFMLPASGKEARGIHADSTGARISNNHVTSSNSNTAQTGTVNGFGLATWGAFCGDNTAAGFSTNVLVGCTPFGGPGNSGG